MLARPTTAKSSFSCASVAPLARAAAVCEAMQYLQSLLMETARYASSLVRGSSAPGSMIAFRLSHVCFSMRGSLAR